MIAVSNLSIRFGKRTLFEEVSVKFSPGCRYGLIGANGVGKSTFMKILAGELDSSTGQVSIDSGCRMSFLRQDHYKYDDFKVIDTVYTGNDELWQLHQKRDDLYDQSDNGTISDEDADYLYGDLEAEYGEKGGYTMEGDAAKLLSGLGIPEEEHHRKMNEISGGLKLRVLLAQALFGDPDILLLDEPTNHLDMDTIEWLENFLMRHEGTVIVISHDRHFLNSVCTNIADLDYQAMRLFTGNYDDFMIANQIQLDRQQRENDKKEKRADELKTFISRFGANASKAKQATARQKELDRLQIEKFKPSSRVAPYIRFEAKTKIGAKVIHAEKLCKSYDKPLFTDFNIHMNNDEKIAIIGTNGVGKTTLLRTLLGKEQADSGNLEIGQTLELSYFPQDSQEVLDENMKAIDWLGKFAPEEGITETELRSAMGRMLFKGEDSLKPINVLSGGERARLIVASMLLEGGNFIVLDEPTNHLDLEAIESLNYALTLISDPIIFVSHDREFVNSLATRIIELHGDGTYTDYPGNFEEYEAWKSSQKKK